MIERSSATALILQGSAGTPGSTSAVRRNPRILYFFLGSAVVAGLGAWARVLLGTFPRDR